MKQSHTDLRAAVRSMRVGDVLPWDAPANLHPQRICCYGHKAAVAAGLTVKSVSHRRRVYFVRVA